jgi:chromosome segregation ATPase
VRKRIPSIDSNKVPSDRCKASLEIRLVDPSGDNHAQSKVNQCVWNVWQTLETKAKLIAQVSNGNIKIRTAEDVDEAVLSFAQVKAMASGNPVIMEKAQLDEKFAALRIQYKGHDQKQSQLYFQVSQTESKLRQLPIQISNIKKDIEQIALNAPVRIDTTIKEVKQRLEQHHSPEQLSGRMKTGRTG